ncbi:MAG: threonine synthase [Omnitrophica WOR_2 bacterium GWB2_45_9]|nr:MAG: threonine synthase [Omnitrophica WOR_2 bacterium GWB2_45_9]OGX52089.1 MAG: threonine synthase [Omnitrophica WOR_2 bacterium RIFOXYB2_FULL_45_11]OGX60853.1 MAG: threonine synthase [Omnitrophica WOR_2 bacterium RIFOXYC2_FULL_45_15]HBU07607.1 threonine synthase [Candidatus Omnitrophota bacterium]
MSYVLGLKCRECGREYPKDVLFVCEYCFGSLEVNYDYKAIKKNLTKETLLGRPKNMWRYKELLPIDKEPAVGLDSGYTPLIKANNLARALGVKELYLKDDSVNHPTLSFKDRVVSVAISKAKEFGFDTVACASTGNLANSVSAQAASCGLKAYIFIPADLEMGKVVASQIYNPNLIGIEGNYDEVNRLCSEIASRYRWAFVNINIRPFYAEGSKSMGYEIAEQLEWGLPKHIVVPSAGGSLITKLWKSFKELKELGFLDKVDTKVYCAQGQGCAPIVTAIKEKSDVIRPVKPKTIAKSLAIGNPADGYYALDTVRKSGGFAEEATDEEIVEAIKLLAKTEGIFTETAGGVTLASAKKLIEQGIIPKDESIVICITGNGLKTLEVVTKFLPKLVKIKPNLASFEEHIKNGSHQKISENKVIEYYI